jgi:hypothetical protein
MLRLDDWDFSFAPGESGLRGEGGVLASQACVLSPTSTSFPQLVIINHL